MSGGTIDGGRHCRPIQRADKPWTEPAALDPMIEKSQKAEVARIETEVVALDSTIMAPFLDGPGLAE